MLHPPDKGAAVQKHVEFKGFTRIRRVAPIAVDTHVRRLSNRLGLSKNSDPDKIEIDLKAVFSPSDWGGLSMRLIQYGRDVCIARVPRCFECDLFDVCPFPDKTSPVK